MSGLLIAAPSSGAGKTTVTLALIAALRRRGIRVASAKAGPDYIDPAFHAAASGGPCVNLDPWAMRPALLRQLAGRAPESADAFVVEAMMGLFDGAADGQGSAADLARALDLRIVLVVDCARQSHSVAALVSGFHRFRPGVSLSGLILNRVGSERHEMLLREALAPLAIPIVAVLGRSEAVNLPERHLGLVQAGEHGDLPRFLSRAADWFAPSADMEALAALARPVPAAQADPAATVGELAPLGQRIAVARDDAFAFAYPHLLGGWRRAGADLSFFSPLADEAPDALADAVYLPGGYPELHAPRLAVATNFKAGVTDLAARGACVFGECGGYMVLGETLRDAGGVDHPMLGLLPLATSFATRRLSLGYRQVTPLAGVPFSAPMRAHEFHYATILREGPGAPLFAASDARGTDLGRFGLRSGSVAGSFLHLVDKAD